MSNPTSSQLLKASKIREKIEALEAEYERLMSGGSAAPKAKRSKAAGRARKKRKLSAEARARISAAAKKRWKKAKASGRNTLRSKS